MIRGICLAMVLLSTLPVAGVVTLHIAPGGNDHWSGRLATPNASATDGPLASLGGARDAIRRLRGDGPLREPVEVIVATGDYQMVEPFLLDARDGGTRSCPITYEAAPGARPTFSGGRKLGRFKPGPGGVWQMHLPRVAAGKWTFEQLWINGRRATRARTPNRLYDYMLNIRENKLGKDQRRPGADYRQVITVRPDDLKPLLTLSPAELHNTILKVYNKWDISTHPITAVDARASTITIEGGRIKPWMQWQRNTRYQLENFRAALDSPGEWFLSGTGILYYHPMAGETPDHTEAVAPIINRFVILKGNPDANRFLEYLTLRGLSFEYGQMLTPSTGFQASQAATYLDAAVIADGARQITLDQCRIRHIGRYGIWFRRGCRDCTIRQCLLSDLGGGGIRIGEGGIAAEPRNHTGEILVDNNIIHAGGRICQDAVGIWIGQSSDNRISHNDISDLFYTGISVGWQWGYGQSLAKRNTIEFNRIHHLGQGVLSDLGGIYTLGPSEGTVVAHNVLYDIHSYSYGGWGLYTDEGSSGIRMQDNLVYDCKSGAFHQNCGRDNIIRNNILAFGSKNQLQATRTEDHLSFTFENNIVYYEHGALMVGPWDKLDVQLDRNCYWNTSGTVTFPKGNRLGQWRQLTGHDKHSIIADPLFVDAKHQDFHLKPDSPALKLGFKPFDPDKAGVYGDAEWTRTASGFTYPLLQLAPEPPTVGKPR